MLVRVTSNSYICRSLNREDIRLRLKHCRVAENLSQQGQGNSKERWETRGGKKNT